MAKSNYVDTPAIIQVLGGIYMNPNLLGDERYHFSEEDFVEDIHRVFFATLNNLYAQGVNQITLPVIDDYLADKPKALATYTAYDGKVWVTKVVESLQETAFNYYYSRVKKMTLLRMYSNAGIDVSDLYDPNNILDFKKKEMQDEWLDNTALNDIATKIDLKVEKIKAKYANNVTNDFVQAGLGARELVDQLKKEPAVGYPLFGEINNGIHRGARLGKFFLRSATTGTGKTRSMIADVCSIGCDELYDKMQGTWVRNNSKEPVLFISTEQDIDEIQTMMQAFIADVDEGHIIDGNYEGDEEDRVYHACEILNRCPIYIKRLPDFSLQDIEDTVKLAIRELGVYYIFHDYIHTSMKILSEISSNAGVKGLREDNILFLISVKLKDICNDYGVFIMSATQLNGDYRTAEVYDQNLLRGAKAIADKIDYGCLMLEVTESDKKALESLTNQAGFEVPEIKIAVYKNRRGRYKNILLWCRAARGTCRIEPLYATNYNFELVTVDKIRIKVQ